MGVMFAKYGGKGVFAFDVQSVESSLAAPGLVFAPLLLAVMVVEVFDTAAVAVGAVGVTTVTGVATGRVGGADTFTAVTTGVGLPFVVVDDAWVLKDTTRPPRGGPLDVTTFGTLVGGAETTLTAFTLTFGIPTGAISPTAMEVADKQEFTGGTDAGVVVVVVCGEVLFATRFRIVVGETLAEEVATTLVAVTTGVAILV